METRIRNRFTMWCPHFELMNSSWDNCYSFGWKTMPWYNVIIFDYLDIVCIHFLFSTVFIHFSVNLARSEPFNENGQKLWLRVNKVTQTGSKSSEVVGSNQMCSAISLYIFPVDSFYDSFVLIFLCMKSRNAEKIQLLNTTKKFSTLKCQIRPRNEVPISYQ